MAFRPSMHSAMLLAWTGQLERAHEEVQRIRRPALSAAKKATSIYVAFHAVLMAIWRGDLVEATLLAGDAVERAKQLGGDVSLFVALTCGLRLPRTAAGKTTPVGTSPGHSRPAGAAAHTGWRSGPDDPGVSGCCLGAIIKKRSPSLEPLLAHLDPAPEATESSPRRSCRRRRGHDPARPARRCGAAIDTLERNGAPTRPALDVAVGARCRAMLLAARGDLEAAASAERKDGARRLLMPLERARTQLLLGQTPASPTPKRMTLRHTFHEALKAFEGLGTPLWARAGSRRTGAAQGAPPAHRTQSRRAACRSARGARHDQS